MPRANDVFAIESSLAQGTAHMVADAVDRTKLPVPETEGNALAAHAQLLEAVLGELGDSA
jgi:hypothetical protein